MVQDLALDVIFPVLHGPYGEDGTVHQRVFDVAGTPDNGATVDPRTCAPYGPGHDSLCAVWSDPEFDPNQRAVYYSRVLRDAIKTMTSMIEPLLIVVMGSVVGFIAMAIILPIFKMSAIVGG